MTTIRKTAHRLSRLSRISMRESAMDYRKARTSGQLARMTKHLCFAATFRDIAKGYLEAA